MLARAPASKLIKASTIMDLGRTVFLFLHDATFEKLNAGLVDRTDQSVTLLLHVADSAGRR